MRLEQVMCDGCGIVLRGKRGLVDIRKQNIGIRGIITVFDEEGGYSHVTRYANEEMSFCNEKCFKDFCNRRIDERNKYREEALMREASENIVYRRNEE